MKRLFGLAAVGLTVAALQAGAQVPGYVLYPADYYPPPVYAAGMTRLTSGYSGEAFTVYKTSSNSTAILFNGDEIDTATLDGFLAMGTGLVTRIPAQLGGGYLSAPLTEAPDISSLNLGNIRAINFHGGTRNGAVYGLSTSSIQALNINPQNYTMMLILRPSMSVFATQASTPGFSSGAVADLVSANINTTGFLNYGSNIITGIVATTGVKAGDVIATGGACILPATTVSSVDTSTSVTMTIAANCDRANGVFLFNHLYGTNPLPYVGSVTSGSTVLNLSTTNLIQAGDQIIQRDTAFPYLTTVQSVDSISRVTVTAGAAISGTAALTFTRPRIRVFNNGNAGDRPGWQITDGGAFNFTTDRSFVQTDPIVLTIRSGPLGVEVWENEQVRAVASRSALTDVVSQLFVGRSANAVPGYEGRSYDGQWGGIMIWNSTLDSRYASLVRAAVYNRYNINPITSHYYTRSIVHVGDSVALGYVEPNLYCYLNRMNLPNPTRIVNLGVAGNTTTQNPAGGPVYSNVQGMFAGVVAPNLTLQQATLGRLLTIHTGGNDVGLGPGGRVANAHAGSPTFDGISDTSDLSVGDFVYASNTLSPLAWILSKTSSSITVTQNSPSTATVGLSFTYQSKSPSAIFAAIQSIAAQGLAAGASNVLVLPILPRTADSQTYNNELNRQIYASGLNVADLLSDPVINANPGPVYADSAHLSQYGCQRIADFLTPIVSNLLP